MCECVCVREKGGVNNLLFSNSCVFLSHSLNVPRGLLYTELGDTDVGPGDDPEAHMCSFPNYRL